MELPTSARVQSRALQVSKIDQHYPPQLEVQVRGPFGSSFSRCFDTVARKGQAHAARYDIVVLFGSGIGLPSALSALRRFRPPNPDIRCRDFFNTRSPEVRPFL